MSSGKRLVLQDDCFDEGEENSSSTTTNANNTTRQTILTVSSSSSDQKNSNNNSNGSSSSEIQNGNNNNNAAVSSMIEAHRRSLISLGQGGVGGSGGAAGNGGGAGGLMPHSQQQFTADDMAHLTSITLSKRHFYSENEYEKGLDLHTFKKLSEFRFDGTTTPITDGGTKTNGTTTAGTTTTIGISNSETK